VHVPEKIAALATEIVAQELNGAQIEGANYIVPYKALAKEADRGQ